MDCSGPGGWRTLHLGVGPLSARVGTVSVAALPVVVGQEPSQCGRPPQGGFFLALGLGARPCLCLMGAVGLSLCVCMCVPVCGCMCVSVGLCVSLGIYGGGRVGMFYHCCF